MKFYILIVTSLFLFAGCAGMNTDAAKPSPTGSMFIQGEVLSSDGYQTEVKAMLDENYSSTDIEDNFAKKVLNMTYLTEGSFTKIGGKEYQVSERRGATLLLLGPSGLAAGQKVQLYLPKKTMVISDLAIKDKNNNTLTANIGFDGMKSAIINSGRFAVVEREKLSAILQEHKLELSGLTDPNQASFVGRLLKAEILLTGDMTKAGANCIFDIKAIDIPTSRIIGNIHESYMCSRITKDLDIRSTDKDAGSFESGGEKGWIVGMVKGGSFITPDYSTGANGTKSSLRLKYEGTTKRAVMVNKLRRDVSGFEGLTFYAKADREMVIAFLMLDTDESGQFEERGKWVKTFFVGKDWQKFDVKMSEMVPSGMQSKNAKSNDTFFSLEQIEQMRFVITPELNESSVKDAVLWVDELKFY